MANILVTDDNRFTRLTLGRYLKELGHEVHFAEDGVQALEVVESAKPDLVLCDLLMPNLDGFGVLEGMKERANPTPVIIVSADIQESSKMRCMGLRASSS